MTKLVRQLVFMAASVSIIACGGEKAALKSPETADTSAPAPASSGPRPPPAPPNTPTASAVRISPEVIKACGISASDAYFAFDSADVRAADAKVLGQLATCFTTGPLAGKKMKLVGHADPRGSSDYNMTLGQSRADAVKGYVAGKGMDQAKLDSSSRGAMDAVGTDEASWASDRRVDIMLEQ